MNYTSVSLAIKNKLTAVTQLAIVYDHEPDELAQYPAATIQSAGNDGEFRSTSQNMLTITHMVRVYFLTANGRDQAAEASLRTTLDAILTAFIKDPTLGGACNYAFPPTTTIQPADREVPTTVAEITIRTNHLVSRLP